MAKPDEAISRVQERVLKHWTNVKKDKLSRREKIKHSDAVKRAADKTFK